MKKIKQTENTRKNEMIKERKKRSESVLVISAAKSADVSVKYSARIRASPHQHQHVTSGAVSDTLKKCEP
jgi:hypothetical protein